MKVFIFVCGEGLGHATRCLAIGRRLAAEGCGVVYGGYGYSRDMILDSGGVVEEILSEIKLVGDAGSLDIGTSVGETLKSSKVITGPRIVRLLRKHKPDVVLSDSYFNAVFAAKLTKTPCALMMNQMKMGTYFRDRGMKLRAVGKLVEKFSHRVFKSVDKIIIPDYPPPYTVCDKNLVFSQEYISKIEYSGPLVRKLCGEVRAKSLRKPHVLSMVGGFGYRKSIFDAVLACSERTRDVYFTLVAGPSVDVDELGGGSSNVAIVKYLRNPLPYLKSCDMAVVAGGHSSMMECLAFGKPMLSIPDMFHSEQQNNAGELERLGVGRLLSYLTPPPVFEACIREVLADKVMHRRCEIFMSLAKSLDGPGKVYEMLKGLE